MSPRDRCWLKAIGAVSDRCQYRADGDPDFAHLIAKHFLIYSANGPRLSKEEAMDRRIRVAICRKHHHILDYGGLTLTRDQLPDSVEDYANEHGPQVRAWLNRKYGTLDD